MKKSLVAKEYYYSRFRQQFEDWIRGSGAHAHPGEGTYVSLVDLRPEKISCVPAEDRMLFHCALACTVLVDQLVYTYFKKDYEHFQRLTLYPKIEYGISGINVSPWHIVRAGVGLTTFEGFLEFFVSDMRRFFEAGRFQSADWPAVKGALLTDGDVMSGAHGEILRRVLEKDGSDSVPNDVTQK